MYIKLIYQLYNYCDDALSMHALMQVLDINDGIDPTHAYTHTQSS